MALNRARALPNRPSMAAHPFTPEAIRDRRNARLLLVLRAVLAIAGVGIVALVVLFFVPGARRDRLSANLLLLTALAGGYLVNWWHAGGPLIARTDAGLRLLAPAGWAASCSRCQAACRWRRPCWWASPTRPPGC
ncbi:MAG: hypothetical protein R3F59_24375 [Myxococcota bacterium]